MRVSAIAAGGSPLENHRRAHRYKIFARGRWLCGDETHNLHLLDISLTGARAHALVTPAAGTRLQIECGMPLGWARVLRVDGQLFGLKFLSSLAMEDIDQIVGERVAIRDTVKHLSCR